MASAASEILQDLVDTLRSAGLFEQVTLGGDSSTAVPRATVLFDGLDVLNGDDAGNSQWFRLRARVKVHTRAGDSREAVTRAADLFAAAQDALLSDPYRSQRCCDLPVGRATEIGRVDSAHAVKKPEIEVVFSVRCHFEIEEQN